MPLEESKKTTGLELNGNHQLLVYADQMLMLEEYLQTVMEKYRNICKSKQGHWFRSKHLKDEIYEHVLPTECSRPTKSKYNN